MTHLIRIELLKLRTTPALWLTMAGTALLTVVSVLTNVLMAGQPGLAPLGSAENAAGPGSWSPSC